MNQFDVGQPVKVFGNRYTRSGPEESTISKVGRKYVTIDGARYEIATQALASGYSGHFRTIEQYEIDERVEAAHMRIKQVQDYAGRLKLPVEALEEIADLIDFHKAADNG